MDITNYKLEITDVPALKPFVKPDTTGFIDMKKWDGTTCVMESDWNYLFMSKQLVIQCTIKKGFKTDGGSIPRLFQNIISPKGQGLVGYIAHDELYGTYHLPQYIADNVLGAICDLSGLGWKTSAIYYSLRMAGSCAYDGKIKLDKHTKGKHPYYGIYRTREYSDFSVEYAIPEWQDMIDKLQEQVADNNPNKK